MPLRIEIGMKEVSQNNAVLVRRDNREKIVATLDSIATTAEKTLQEIQESLYQKALKFQKDNTTILENYKKCRIIFKTRRSSLPKPTGMERQNRLI